MTAQKPWGTDMSAAQAQAYIQKAIRERVATITPEEMALAVHVWRVNTGRGMSPPYTPFKWEATPIYNPFACAQYGDWIEGPPIDQNALDGVLNHWEALGIDRAAVERTIYDFLNYYAASDEDLADAALNAAGKEIQDRLGIDDGFFASIYWTGEAEERFKELMTEAKALLLEYASAERDNAKRDEEEAVY